ncbi:MAG: thioredoxin domain-containing protein [Acidobacteria bacterium]|nr:thioredoxin domain-containing protein [Acidobacteriota bacterium]
MSLNPRPTRSEQREAARAKARALREQRAKGDKRKRFLVTTSVTLAIIGVVAGVAWVIFTYSQDAINNGENAKKVPANVTSLGGVLVGKNLQLVTPAEAAKTNHIVIYQDYQCPICKLFEDPNSAQMRTWADKGLAVIEYHPISFLDGQSLNSYSSRAANAAFCVANSQPNKFFDVNNALYANQPQENTSGPTDSQIKDTLKSAGVVISSEINQCIDQKRYSNFIGNKTNEAFNQNAVTGNTIPGGTPHILVNGVQYTWNDVLADLPNPGRFAQFFDLQKK